MQLVEQAVQLEGADTNQDSHLEIQLLNKFGHIRASWQKMLGLEIIIEDGLVTIMECGRTICSYIGVYMTQSGEAVLLIIQGVESYVEK